MIVVVVFLFFSTNIVNFEQADFEEIYQEAAILSDTLISAGTSAQENISTGNEISITNGNHRINYSKLENVSNLGYSALKLRLKTKYDYLIFFENESRQVISIENVTYIGKSGLTKENFKSVEQPQSIISLSRFLTYDSRIVTMNIYLWE